MFRPSRIFEEDAVRDRIGAQRVVDQVQVLGDEPQRVRVDRDRRRLTLGEEAQDVDRIGEEGLGVGHVDAAVPELVAARRVAAAEGEDGAQGLADAGLGLDVARFQPGKEDAGKVAHMLRLQEIVLHEPLHGPLALGVLVAEDARDLDLGVEGQLLHCPAGDEVQVDADRPEKARGAAEGGVFLGGEDAEGDQVFAGLGPVEVFRNPEQGLEIAQAALAFLHVGFEQVARAALPLMALGALLELQLDEFRAGAGEEVMPQPVVQRLGQRDPAPEKAVLQQRRADRGVLAGLPQAFVDGADGLADLQLEVPQAVEHRLDQALAPGRLLVGRDEEQVDVREGRHLAAAVAADRDHRDML